MTDQPASRRSFYIKMLESAYVKDNKVLIRYINGKEFVVNLIRNRGRIIQTDFDVDVFFKGKEQYTVRIYSNTETFSLLSVKSHIKKHVKNADVFIQASKKRIEIMLAELAELVKEYKKDKGKYNSN